MDHAKLDSMYQSIAQTVMEMIPEEWTKVYVYAERMDGVQSNYFYHYPTANEEPVQIFDIPELSEVDEEEFEQLMDQLDDHLKNLLNEFQESGHEPWSTITLIINHSGKFQGEFGYEDLSDPATDFFERRVIWKYNLGFIPKDDYARRILEEYLKNTEGESRLMKNMPPNGDQLVVRGKDTNGLVDGISRKHSKSTRRVLEIGSPPRP